MSFLLLGVVLLYAASHSGAFLGPGAPQNLAAEERLRLEWEAFVSRVLRTSMLIVPAVLLGTAFGLPAALYWGAPTRSPAACITAGVVSAAAGICAAALLPRVPTPEDARPVDWGGAGSLLFRGAFVTPLLSGCVLLLLSGLPGVQESRIALGGAAQVYLAGAWLVVAVRFAARLAESASKGAGLAGLALLAPDMPLVGSFLRRWQGQGRAWGDALDGWLQDRVCIVFMVLAFCVMVPWLPAQAFLVGVGAVAFATDVPRRVLFPACMATILLFGAWMCHPRSDEVQAALLSWLQGQFGAGPPR